MKDVPCFILGNAPSLRDKDLSILEQHFTVGINRIFYMIDPTVLMWQDLALWVQEKKRVMETKAIKYVRRGADTRGGFLGFQLESRDHRLTDNLRKLYGRGSSGAIAYEFAHKLGCNPIILVGMDCKNGPDKMTDFYGVNPMHKPHTLPNCVQGLKFIRRASADRKIINCSLNDVWDERHTIEQAIEMLPKERYCREELQRRLLGDMYETVISNMH